MGVRVNKDGSITVGIIGEERKPAPAAPEVTVPEQEKAAERVPTRTPNRPKPRNARK